jgi:alkylhydroperoxidase family enzyme
MTTTPEPRIAPLNPDQLSDEARDLVARLRANFGQSGPVIPEAVATMLRHPSLYQAQVDFVLARTKVLVTSPRDMELVILRTGWLLKSGYIWGEHLPLAKKAGITPEQIEALTQGSSAPGWNDRDRALNKLCEELHETSCVTDETWQIIAQNFSDKEIIEIITYIGIYHEVAFTYNALRVRLQPTNAGLAAR